MLVRVHDRSLPKYEPIFVSEYVVCSLDICNLILIESLAMGMTNQTQK